MSDKPPKVIVEHEDAHWIVECDDMQYRGNTEAMATHLGFWMQEVWGLRRQLAEAKRDLQRAKMDKAQGLAREVHLEAENKRLQATIDKFFSYWTEIRTGSVVIPASVFKEAEKEKP